MDYVNGYGLDTNVYDALVERLYGFEEYYYYKQDAYYKDYVFVMDVLDKIRCNKPMDDSYKNAVLGWYISFKNLERRMSPKTFIFKPTDACQLKCLHCYNQKIERHNHYMTYEEFVFLYYKQRELIKRFVHYKPIDDSDACYHFESGEPTLNSDLPKMIRFVNKQGYRVRVLSNGIHIPDEVIEALKGDYRNIIQISFDGFRDTHDFIRGVGSFDKSIKTLDLLKSRKMKLACNFTANSKNYREIRDFKDFMKERYNIDLFSSCYISQENNILYPLDKEGYDYVIPYLPTHIINTNIGTPGYSAGNLSIIEHNGDYISDVHSYTGDCIANYFTDSIEEMLCKIKKHVIRLRSVPVYCFDCKKVDGCLGGMLCSTFKKYGKYNIEDMACHILGAKERGEMYEIGTL